MNRVLVVLDYHDNALTPGGTMRCEPSTPEELVEEIDRSMNASNFGGLISLRIATPEDLTTTLPG